MGLLTGLPRLLIYEAIPTGLILAGVALVVWFLTSLGTRRTRSRRRVLILSSALAGGLILVLAGFLLALQSLD